MQTFIPGNVQRALTQLCNYSTYLKTWLQPRFFAVVCVCLHHLLPLAENCAVMASCKLIFNWIEMDSDHVHLPYLLQVNKKHMKMLIPCFQFHSLIGRFHYIIRVLTSAFSSLSLVHCIFFYNAFKVSLLFCGSPVYKV